MATYNQSVHSRWLKLEITCDEGDDTTVIDVVEYFRTGVDYEQDTNALLLAGTASAASAEATYEFDQVIPPATHLALEATFQA